MGRSHRLGRALLASGIVGASTLLTTPAPAAEDTQVHQVVLPVRTTSWTDSVTVPRFDPALGELRAVDVLVEAGLEGTIALENLTASPATLEASLAATVTVARPAGTLIASATPTVTQSDDLAAFDGALDHAGASGATHAITGDEDASVELAAAPDLALFTGTTPITLPTSGTGGSTGPTGPDADAVLTTLVGAQVTVAYTYVTDTRPPDPPTITASPGAFTADPNPVVTFTAEAGATTECQLDTPAGPGSWASCTSPWTTDLTAGADGAHTFRVRAIDGSGNVGEPAVRPFTLDRTVPALPVFTGTPPAVSMQPLPVWAFTVEAGATARCSLDGAPPVLCTSPFAPDLTGAADGLHTLVVHAVDAASNAGPAATSSYTLDRVAPGAPVITIPAPSPSSDSTPTWTFTVAPDAVGATCSVDGGTYSACTSPFTANLAPPPGNGEADHTLAIRNHDQAGNHSVPVTATYVLDRHAPDPPTITGPPSPSNVLSPVWTITGEPKSTTECRLDAGAWAPCDGTFTTTFGPGSDGVHTLSARSTDTAGNLGGEATATYVLDTTAPAAPEITGEPADPSSSPLPSWTFTVEPLAGAQCSVDGGPWSPCSSPNTVDLTTAADGPHTLAVRAVDAVGNQGPVASSTFTLDRTAPPAPVITAGPPSPGSSRTVTWAFTAPEGTTTTCRIDLQDPIPCDGALTTTLTDDGTHRFAVRARDLAGNLSGAAVATYVLDTVAPTAPAITGEPASPSNVRTPQWTFAVEAGSAGQCSLDGAGWVGCATSFSADLSGAGDGPHTFAVRSVDAAGNTGPPAVDTFVLDTTAPASPQITDRPPASSADDTPTWTFAVDPDATAQCRVDDGPWGPCSSSLTADLTGDPDGTHSLEVRAVDGVGNVGPVAVAAYDLDRQAPAAPTFTSEPLSPGNDVDPTWTFTFEPGTTAWCTLDGGTAEACPGTFGQSLAGDEGEHSVTIVVVDAAGNRSPEVTVTYTLDTTAPAAPVILAPRTPGNDSQPEWSISAEAGTVTECTFDDGPVQSCGALFAVDLTGQDGTHRLAVVARDAAGNTSVASTSVYVLDTVAPAAPILTHTPDASAWVWRFTLEPGARAECSVDGNPWRACASGLAGGPADRTVRFEVRAVDQAANRSPVTGTTVTPTRATGPAPGGAGPTPSQGGGGGSGPLEPEAGPTPVPPPTAEPDPVLPRPVGEGLTPRPDPVLPRDPLLRNPDNRLSNAVAELLQSAAETTTIPVLVLLVVLTFVAVQNRIDRRDPKLLHVPVRDEPEYRTFE